MAQATGIEWTDASSNPIKYRDNATGKDVWACVKHSPGCAHCYAESLASRFDRGGPFTQSAMDKVTPYLCEHELRNILKKKSLTGKRVFVGDMTDIFGAWVTDQMLDTLFCAMAIRKDVTFQILTKRAERLAAYMTTPGRKRLIAAKAMGLSNMLASQEGSHSARLKLGDFEEAFLGDGVGGGPFPNLWLGVSVEDQRRADERIPHLLSVPAVVRFLSCEPLLGPVNIKSLTGCKRPLEPSDCRCFPEGLHWVIIGGESGSGARACDVASVASLVKQCQAARVACFVKQLGSKPEDSEPVNDGNREYFPLQLRDRKGGDMSEWATELRVREFPEVPA